MACVGLRKGEPELQSGIALRDSRGILQRLARQSAIADHVEPPIPARRQAHLECDLRRERAGDSTVGTRGFDDRDDFGVQRHDTHVVPGLQRAARSAWLDVRSGVVDQRRLRLDERLSLHAGCMHQRRGCDQCAR